MIVGLTYKQKFLSLWNKWLKINHLGINYGNIIANELANICHHDDVPIEKYSIYSHFTFKKALKYLIYSQVNTPYLDLEGFVKNSKNYDVLFLYEEDGREDYKRQCEFVLNDIRSLKVAVIHIDKGYNTKQLSFSILLTLSKLNLLLKLLFHFGPQPDVFINQTFKKIWYLYHKAFLYHDYCWKIKHTLKPVNNLVLLTFTDMKEYGNMMTQVCRQFKIPSVALQHAVYTKSNDYNWSQSAINYLNFSSDYFFAWGEAVKHQLKETPVKQDQFIIAGCNAPGITRKLITTNQLLPEQPKFGLMMSVEYTRASNLAMLEIAQQISNKFNMPYDIAFHPTNDVNQYLSEKYKPANYQKGLKDAETFFKDKTFLICHTTTVYLNSLTFLRKCFRYKDDAFIDIGGLDDMFENFEGLESRVSGKEYIIDNDAITEINKLLNFHFGNESDSYANASEQILH